MIEKIINYSSLSTDIVILKQSLSPTFEPEFQLPGETLEETTNHCFVSGMFFKKHTPLEKSYQSIWLGMGIPT